MSGSPTMARGRRRASPSPIARVLAVSGGLGRELAALPGCARAPYAYHVWTYAWAGWRAYIERFGGGDKEVLLVGMNPGPFGMAQTGVPFGAVPSVRGWLGLEAAIGRPARCHPKRPILGLACPRAEVSGSRLWGWAEASFGEAAHFFARAMVVNLCPVMWCDGEGRNVTPLALPAELRRALLPACRRALRALVAAWRCRLVVGVGGFAAGEVALALGGSFAGRVGRLMHPSPANPAANRGWREIASRTMAELVGPSWPGRQPAAAGRASAPPGGRPADGHQAHHHPDPAPVARRRRAEQRRHPRPGPAQAAAPRARPIGPVDPGQAGRGRRPKGRQPKP